VHGGSGLVIAAHPKSEGVIEPRMRRGFPINSLLTAVVVALIVVAAGGMALSAYQSMTRSLDETWDRLAGSMAERTMQEANFLLALAGPAGRLSEETVDDGGLDPKDHEAMLSWLEHGLEADPHVTWMAWADIAGTYIAAYRWPEGEELRIRKTLRLRQDGKTWHRAWERRGERWELIEDKFTDYDPRVRPFWDAATQSEEGAWVDPYLFLSRMQPGVSWALPSRDGDNVLRGVWIVDFECGPLSDYLAGLDVGRSGRVYLLDHLGQVVGHPEGLVAGNGQILRAGDHEDAQLSQAWLALEQGDFEPGVYDVGDRLASAHRFPEESRVPWWVLVVVPKDELYGPATRQARRSLVLTVGVVLLAMLAGLIFSRQLSSAVSTVEAEMNRVARFELSEVSLAETPSLFKEINALASAHDRMKQGLRSFGRYVPQKLVAQLLRSGTAASLGGGVRQVTVLFCEITAFDDLIGAAEPDTLMRALSDYLGVLNTHIDANGGTVAQYLGDATMAFWGAPDRQEDHALQSCRAALAMQAAIDELAGLAQERGLPPLPSTLGVNTGDCIVGNIGAAERFAYSILGDPVNTAARIRGLNKVYGTTLLIGETTADRVCGKLLVRPVDWVTMKGKARPILVHELLTDVAAAPNALREEVNRYAEALRLYRSREFEAAIQLFRETRWAEPLVSRAESFLTHPPPAAWDGSFTMSTK